MPLFSKKLKTTVNTDYKYLSELNCELAKSIMTPHKEYTDFIDEIGTSKTIDIEVDRLTHDNDQLQDKTSEIMHFLSTRPCAETPRQTSETLKYQTILSRHSTNSSDTSKLRRKAQEAKAAEEAKYAELEALAIQEEQEAELAKLRIQQKLELARKRREIQ